MLDQFRHTYLSQAAGSERSGCLWNVQRGILAESGVAALETVQEKQKGFGPKRLTRCVGEVRRSSHVRSCRHRWQQDFRSAPFVWVLRNTCSLE